MFTSIIEDIKNAFRSGDIIMRIIIINVAVFVVTALIGAFAPTFYGNTMVHWIAVPGNPLALLFKPWTIFSYMFVHAGFSHIFWNMIGLYWFGRIVEDMIGSKHIIPIYLIGGLVGAAAYILSYYFLIGYLGTYMVGASAAVMAMLIVAGRINPDKEFHFPIIGRVRIKYIVLTFILMDLVFIGKNSNTGGHIAHLGGMVMGWLYYNQIGSRNELANIINGSLEWISGLFYVDSRPKRKSNLKVKFKSDKIKTMTDHRSDSDGTMQQKVDAILDKIKRKGYDSLTDIEKETLYQASKKSE
ncbi:MAG: rhomboid family intramembrane serine protease [Saprospiraceae bacterium]|nr:rhomboid family intramembrane serine protease [Saprospiraceae bacterium]